VRASDPIDAPDLERRFGGLRRLYGDATYARLRVARPRAQDEVRHRRDAGQRLAAETHRADAFEVLGARDLAGGVPIERQPGVGGIHAVPVVLDPDQLLAAHLDRDRDARRVRIDGVFDEFLQLRRKGDGLLGAPRGVRIDAEDGLGVTA